MGQIWFTLVNTANSGKHGLENTVEQASLVVYLLVSKIATSQASIFLSWSKKVEKGNLLLVTGPGLSLN